MNDDRTGEPVPDPIFEPTAADEVRDELQFHIDMRTRELIARGMTTELAERAARERFADLDRVSQECHRLAEQRGTTMRRTRYLTNLVQDIRFALRLLRQRPGFALMAVLPIALGIGAATAMYSVVDTVMLRPLPFTDPGRLVAVWATEAKWRGTPSGIRWDRVVIGQVDIDALRARATSLSQVAAWGRASVVLNTNGTLEPLSAVRVTGNIIPMLGVQPVLGRTFGPEENRLDGPRVAMLSWETWQNKFGRDSAIVGRSVVFDTAHVTVVGVLPAGLRLDRTGPAPAIWLPAFRDSSDRISQHNRSYRGLARLAPGATVAQANAEVGRVLADVKASWNGKSDGTSGRASSWQADQVGDTRTSLMILSGAVALLLLIACVNVATLMLGEAARRQQEIFARNALGASPARLARQLLTESVVIAGVGAIFGALLAWAGTRALVAAAPPGIPGLADAHVDARVLLFTAVCAITVGLAFGVAPTLALLRWGDRSTVRIGAGQTARGARTIQRGLVAIEVALSLVMLVGCSLLGRSLVKLTAVDPGFVSDGLFEVQSAPQRGVIRDDARVASYFTTAMRELQSIPGVQAVSGSSGAPFSGMSSSSAIRVEGVTYPDDGPPIQQRVILPGYLRTIGVPIVAGRNFDNSDQSGSPLVAILSQSAVARDWAGRSPIGKRVIWQDRTWTVIGVAGDVRYDRLSRDVEPTIYIPSEQDNGNWMTLVVRATGDTHALEAAIKARLAPVDPGIAVRGLDAVPALIQQSYSEENYRTMLGALFGVLASALAGFGLFGLISRTVARRMREAGIRVALGASGVSVTRLMLRETLVGAAIGIAIGVPAAAFLARALAPYLFGVRAADPVAYGMAFTVLAITVVAATIPPARRAGRVDPALVLRSD